MIPASTCVLPFATEFHIFEAKLEQLLRYTHLSLFLMLVFTVFKSTCRKEI